jgi:hypothetical protein
VFFTVAIKPLMTSSAGNAPLSGAWDRAREYDYSFVYPRYCGMWSFQMVLNRVRSHVQLAVLKILFCYSSLLLQID